METLRLRADPLLAPTDLLLVTSLLCAGSLVALPTETVYGLAADVFQQDALQKIFAVKGRPQDNPLIAHISGLEQMELLALDLPPSFQTLAERFWPGPLTLVVRRHPRVPAIVSAQLSSIAIRMPAHLAARQIITAHGSPLAAPSANLSGKPSPTSAEDVLEDFAGAIPAVVDGGSCSYGIESTVVSLLGSPTLLRPGAIARGAIEEVLQQKLQDPQAGAPVESPGMKYRHYAPRARVRLLEKDEATAAYRPSELCARNLYSHLRKADRLGYEEIAIVLDETLRSDEALMNRLLRASQSS